MFTRIRWTLALVSVVASLTGCDRRPAGSPVATKSSQTSATRENPASFGDFVGVLPCADCSGIRTELRLEATAGAGNAPGQYELKETYLATRDGDRPVVRTGRWTILRGSASDRDATVYQLDFDRPDSARSFLLLRNELRLLDRTQQEISSSFPHSLYRLSRQTQPPVELAEADAGKTVDVAIGQEIVVRLGSNRSAGYSWVESGPSTTIVASLGEPAYTPRSSQAGAVGAEGLETWSFRAYQVGEGELRLEYRRPWEREQPVARTVSFAIRVVPAR